MPWLSSIQRRTFMQATLGGMVLGIEWLTTNAHAEDAARWAWLADTHVPEDKENEYRGFYPQENFKKVVPQVMEQKPDGIVITGDLARLEGKPGDYAAMKEILQPAMEEMPVCMALGNHDHRGNFLSAFEKNPGEKQDVSGKHVVVIDTGPVRFVVLDSLLYVNKVAGLLGKAQRAWLKQFLSQSDEKPIILFFHHTIGDGDGDMLDFDRVMRIVQPHSQVKAMVYGHSHVYRLGVKDGIQLINLPAVGYNFRDSEPVGWVEAKVTSSQGKLTLHAFDGESSKDGSETLLEWRT